MRDGWIDKAREREIRAENEKDTHTHTHTQRVFWQPNVVRAPENAANTKRVRIRWREDHFTEKLWLILETRVFVDENPNSLSPK
jgi:hypothetical protein